MHISVHHYLCKLLISWQSMKKQTPCHVSVLYNNKYDTRFDLESIQSLNQMPFSSPLLVLTSYFMAIHEKKPPCHMSV